MEDDYIKIYKVNFTLVHVRSSILTYIALNGLILWHVDQWLSSGCEISNYTHTTAITKQWLHKQACSSGNN
jgi:hypothetical protein